MAKWDKPSPPSPIGGPPPPVKSPQPLPEAQVLGTSPDGAGVTGESNSGLGVLGSSDSSYGVSGISTRGTGVYGGGLTDGVLGWGRQNGVHGQSESTSDGGVWGENIAGGIGVKATSVQGYGIWAGGKTAGHFEGDIELNGNLQVGSKGDVILNDCAELFDVTDTKPEPGTVMVIDENGNLRPSSQAYDKKVAGVVSGAGNFRPGIILGNQQSESTGVLIALLGKVFCKVDAEYSPIEVGDLLTSSPTPGCAMKAEDRSRAFGCVLGKALDSLGAGQGLIPILVALQ